MNEINLLFPFDYIVVFLITIIILFSFWKGFIQSVLGLLTWVGSILVTIYSYNSFAIFITSQILKITFFQNYEYLTNIFSIIISIPIIFLISLFILKKVRKFLSSDLDKQILGIFFDKLFGIIYGIIFSYIITSAIIIMIERFQFEELNLWINDNSNIIFKINNFNTNYINSINYIQKIEE